MTAARARGRFSWRAALRLSLVALLGVGLVTCGKNQKSTVAPKVHLPPEVEAVFPAARSVSVPYDTYAWVQFKTAMDPTTINDRTVFLKLDTQRIPSTVTYDAATRRILITPHVTLALLRTHTVEISPAVATADHGSLGDTYFWQFRTIGVRRPGNPVPAIGGVEESPFVTLQWTGTDTTGLGDVAYEVYVGADSDQVASGATTPIVTKTPFYLPTHSWPLESAFYWKVNAHNRTTDEQLDGPVWRFATMSPAAAIDSIVVPPAHWGYYLRTARRQVCNSSWGSGPDYNSAIYYPLRTLPQDIRLAGAMIILTPNVQTNLVARQPMLYDCLQDWRDCPIAYPGPPNVGNAGLLAQASVQRLLGLDRYVFQSDTLTAFIEAAIKRPDFHGFVMGSTLNTGYMQPVSNVFGLGQLTIYYYVPSTARARAATAR